MCRPTGDVWWGRGPYRTMSPRISTGGTGKCAGLEAMYGGDADHTARCHHVSQREALVSVQAWRRCMEGTRTIPADVTTYLNGGTGKCAGLQVMYGGDADHTG